MKKIYFLTIALLLLVGCPSQKKSTPVSDNLFVVAAQTQDSAMLLGCRRDDIMLNATTCASSLREPAPAWLIINDRTLRAATLTPSRSNPQLFQAMIDQSGRTLSGDAWMKLMKPVDYNSMDFRNQAATLIETAGGEGCAPCIGPYGSGYADLDGDGEDETVFVLEVDDWTGVFVQFGRQKPVLVVGGKTALPTALEEAENPPNPAALFHRTYTVLAALDLTGNGKLELIIRTDEYDYQRITAYRVNKDHAPRLSGFDLSIKKSAVE